MRALSFALVAVLTAAGMPPPPAPYVDAKDEYGFAPDAITRANWAG